MSDPPEKSLVWPPTKEDLERFYIVERLSAAKIAKAYGLKYKNPKVAGSTILHQLKKNGIKRRDKADHVRKFTETMVDVWVRRYEAGESLKQIARGDVDPVTVWNHLRKQGVQIRDKVEAQIAAVSKYERRPFAGDEIDRWYLMGLRYGDLDVVGHGRAIRVRLSTTHPKMAQLFENLFSPYGHVARYPRRSPFTAYEWNLEVDLDQSFEFLLAKVSRDQLAALPNHKFMAFLAGLFDAEGSILLHNKGKWGGFELVITNTDIDLLDGISSRLEAMGVFAPRRDVLQNVNRGIRGGSHRISRLEIVRSEDVQSLVTALSIRHGEKVAKARIALLWPPNNRNLTFVEISEKWRQLIREIKSERDLFVHDAKVKFEAKL